MATGKSGYVDIASGWVTARLYWSDEYDISTNTSKVSITNIQFKSSNWYGVVYYLNGTVSINGSAVASFSGTKGGYTFKPSTQSTFYAMGVASGFAAPPYTSESIAHNSDGSKTTTISISVSGYTTSGEYGSGWSCSGSSTVTLTTIPRASSMTIANGTLGTAQTITVSRATTSFTHTITYTCGTASGTICTKSSSESISFTPPITLASQNVSAVSVNVTFKLQTYSGDTAIGSVVTKTVTMAIPSSVVPTVSLTVSDAKGYLSTYGGYVQNKSRAKAAATGSGTYGSTITSYKITCGSSSSSSANATFDLPSSGTITVKATVTDSRGRSASKSVKITVVAYSSPSVKITSLLRQNEDGTTNAQAGYAKATFNATVTSLSSKNSASYTFLYRVRGTTTWTEETLTDLAGQYTITGSTYGFAASVNAAYEVAIKVTDNFGSVISAYSTIQAIGALLDFDKTNNAIGIGQRATTTDTLTIGLYTEFLNGTNIEIPEIPEIPEQIFKDLGTNPIASTANDTPAKWVALGIGKAWYSKTGCLTDQPSQYGFLLNFVNGSASDVYQIFNSQASGPTYYRSGNSSGWNGTWKKYMDSGQIPAMNAGTAYALQEKFMGKQVYMKVIACGTPPNAATGKKTIAHGLDNNDIIFAKGGMVYYNNSGTIQSSFSIPHPDGLDFMADKNGITFISTHDYPDVYTAYVWIKYIKF